MGNEISLQLRLTGTSTAPVTLDKSLGSHAKMCQSSAKPNEAWPIEQVNSKDCVTTQMKEINSEQGLRVLPDQKIQENAVLEVEQDIPEPGNKVLTMEHLQAEEDERGKDWQTKFTSSIYEQECEKKLEGIRKTLRSLDDSLRETRGLEAEKSFRYSQLKTKNMSLQIDLDKANKRNKNMLNLFRQNAAEIGFGHLRSSSTLPESLRKDVQRIWSQKYFQKCRWSNWTINKYDILLEQNNQLKTEAAAAGLALEDKDRQIENLQQRLLNLAEDLIQREKTIEKICTKFLSLKQRKDEQEVLLRGSVETLQDALQKAKGAVPSSKSESCIMPSKDAIIAREVRRNDRLAYENSLLRALLQEAKRYSRSSRSSSTISLCD